jgi:RNA polymerase sigma factor (sigma-70 family)
MQTTEILKNLGDDGPDRERLNELCKRYLPRVHDWAQQELGKKLRRRIDSEDPVQDSFYTFISQLTALKPKNSDEFTALMRVILRRRISDAANHFMALKRRIDREMENPEALERAFGLLAYEGPTAEQDAMREEELGLLGAAILLLPEYLREVIDYMMTSARMPKEQEIAEKLGIDRSAARRRRAKALLKLVDFVNRARAGDILGALDESPDEEDA